ncbi:DNA primase, phage associated [Lachnospiraceae bacterium TWA4]|nr:DNA primase, phage associated [Lachnospiraceae bacterium TWA4]
MSFDLVRVHKFSDEDEKKSFNQMVSFAMTLDEVKLQIANERRQQVEEDFADLTDEDSDWRTKLRFQPRSKVLENSVWNEMLILNNDPDFANFGYNEMANRIQVTGKVPWERPRDNKFWRDADTAQMKALMDLRYVTFSTRNHDVAFTKVADDRRFHPIRNYLDGLPEWDKVPRIDTILVDYFGAEDSSYTRAVSRKTLVAAVARIYHPGTKFDSVLILNGSQGIGKSTFFAKLAGDWFSDSLTLTDMKDKAGAEKLQGYWILELGELAGMKKVDIESVKSFISRTDDEYRPSYGKTVESHPRQCIIVGSTNAETGFLRDITGNRRFWPVTVSGNSKKKSWQLTDADVLQLWAEAVFFYKQGEALYLEGSDAFFAIEKQTEAMETDEREGLVRQYLDTLLPEDWESMDLYERRHFLSGSSLTDIGRKGTVQRKNVCNMEIWCECFCKEASTMKKSDSYELGAIMQKIEGWSKANLRYVSIYGRQRVYERCV